MLKIYLADLVYDTIKTNYTVPLNIAYIAALLEKRFSKQVKIILFKYPKELEKAISKDPPDIIGLSHYSWNSRLSLLFVNMVKRLNPKVITVMGGPNIRTEPSGIKAFLKANPNLDYYIMFEGEESFADLVGGILNGKVRPTPNSCATIIGGKLIYSPVDFIKKPKEIDLPSPYLTGWLNKFLKDPNMIPLLETNRGCPFGCLYCAWGVTTLSKVRLRDLSVIKKEIEYVAENSAGQVKWIFCDANFGLFDRDVEIAKIIRNVMDKKGFPVLLDLYHSKNTSERNIEIAKIIKTQSGYIAIQSSDPCVLKCCGRGGINMDHIKAQIKYYKDNNMEVGTDILIGLPGESVKNHLTSLKDSFDIGFDDIRPYNIRLLPGSKYEDDTRRKEYAIKTKFRPIFGAYGIYDEKIVFEIEESVRATKDMSEKELNNFKIHHWLIYFAWNVGMFKPILKFAQKRGANPGEVLDKLAHSKDPSIKRIFDYMKNKSMEEWFNTKEDMIKFYKSRRNYDKLVNEFVKLNFLYIALVYKDAGILTSIQNELVRILREEYRIGGILFDKTLDLTEKLACKDLLQGDTSKRVKYPGEVVSLIINNPELLKKQSVEVEIYRPKKYDSLCRFYLMPNGKKDISLKNFTRFLENDGMFTLRNKIRLVS
ncbi:MAG: cobalamin-dependent protein [bacterium]|nr:cobalamin-dependent protein [bacterium]